MKKLLFVLTAMLITSSFCFAEDMKVMALNDFSTDKPSEIRVKVLETMTLDEGVVIPEGSVVTGNMVDVIPAKRLKRDAQFSFQPLSYTTPQNERYTINKVYKGKFSPKFELDKAKLAKSAVLSVGNHLMTGFSTGVHAVKGAIDNEQGNRLVSSVNNVYEHSFLSYIEKGGATCIKAESLFSFKFKENEAEESFSDKPVVTKHEGFCFEDIPGYVPGHLPRANQPE